MGNKKGVLVSHILKLLQQSTDVVSSSGQCAGQLKSFEGKMRIKKYIFPKFVSETLKSN